MNTARLFHILLVEDSPTDRLIAVQALKSAAIQTTLSFAEDGVDALDYLRAEADPAKGRPDLILLDLNLPRKDGRAVLEEIKADIDLRLIPVVVLTTSNAREDVRGAYALHANSYMTKPVDFSEFSRSLSDLVNYWFEVVTLPTR
jgi:two-component system, cell cycle sensor histidine kinase and response regulator CckA